MTLPAPLPDSKGWPWIGAPSHAAGDEPDRRLWPRISVVMPSFNQGPYIEAAIRSVLLQGYPDLELIVIDGGSTDATVAAIEKYRRHLTYSASAPDRGPADALNRGFARATGEILAFLNADDLLLPDALTTVAREWSAGPATDVLYGHGHLIDAAGARGVPIFSDRWNPEWFTLGYCTIVQPAAFFRRTTFERTPGFDTTLRTAWDLSLWADLLLAGGTYRMVDRFLAAVRLHPESITGGARFRGQRPTEVRGILDRVRGRPETRVDRARTAALRVRRFLAHPARTIRQRRYIHSTLQRWSL